MKTSFSACLFLLFLIPFALASGEDNQPDSSKFKKDYFAFAGTYTAKTQSKGIYAFRYDASSGKLAELGVAAETSDPSFIAIHPGGKYRYAVNESGKSSMVT